MLVIIGVLVAVVLQGQRLIASAEYKSLRHDIADYESAFDAFRDRYSALPGDFDAASTRLDSGLGDGDGDGVIEDGPQCSATGNETCRAWQHLRAAELIKGDSALAGTNAPPGHVYQGDVSAYFTGTQGNAEFGHKLLVLDVPADFANQLDDDLDDGDPASGAVSCNNGCSGTPLAWPADPEAFVDVIYAL